MLIPAQGSIWGGFALSTMFVAFRIWVRLHRFKNFFMDDVFVLIALLMLLATAITWQCISRYMYQAIYIGRGELAAISPTFVTDTQTYIRGQAAILILFTSGLWSVKTSFLLFFRRLSDGVSGQKGHWWIAFLLTLATYFGAIGTIPYRCLIPALENIAHYCVTPKAILLDHVSLLTNTVVDVLTDLISKYPSAIHSYILPLI